VKKKWTAWATRVDCRILDKSLLHAHRQRNVNRMGLGSGNVRHPKRASDLAMPTRDVTADQENQILGQHSIQIPNTCQMMCRGRACTTVHTRTLYITTRVCVSRLCLCVVGYGHTTRKPQERNTYKVVTWLILPVVICLSKRLSHACLSINEFIQ
jgi:hypothetical protein